jgi:hypothetical protein
MATENEIAARRPVWVALAGLFLDTDVRMSYSSVARTLAESPYAMEELRRILDDEVTPVVQGNLLSVAGEWAAFDDDWLVADMTKRMGIRRMAPLLVNMDREWNVVARLAGILRTLPSEKIFMRSRAWDVLLRLILNRKAKTSDRSTLQEFSLAELEAFFRADLWAGLKDDAKRLAKLEPEIYPDEQEIESNWRNFVL